jgi:hypothetical protein
VTGAAAVQLIATDGLLTCCLLLSHGQVEIRACTSRESPIIVDCNHVYSQFFVDGIMTWRGTIKFINSYPSLRRAGLWELISPLHIEKAGQLHFQVSRTAPGSESALAVSSQWGWVLFNKPFKSRTLLQQVHCNRKFIKYPG